MELLKNPKQSISGKEVDVKKATPKPNEMGGMRGGRGGRGGRGRGRGNSGAWGRMGWRAEDSTGDSGVLDWDVLVLQGIDSLEKLLNS